MENSRKRVAIITRHAISNYGSVLQAYALQSVVEDLGYECEIIDYIRTDEGYKKIADTLVKKSSWNRNPITRIIYKAIQSPEYIIMGRAFEKYRGKMLKTTEKRYSSLDELTSDMPDADIYCTGSDQVWGEIGNDAYDEAYFLSFVPDYKKRIAYAASFGKANLDYNDKKISDLLNRYDKITVRESSAVNLVKGFGVDEVKQVIDPTLLINSEEWSRLCTRDIKEKYVLLYQLHSNSEMDEYAKEFAKRYGAKLIRITPLLHRIFKGGKAVFLPDIEEFLSYIKNASYMITDSFHGTAFAINLNIPFTEVLPNETKTRNQSILELTGLTDRILQGYDDFSLMNKEIDFTYANSKIEEERAFSKELLSKMLQG